MEERFWIYTPVDVERAYLVEPLWEDEVGEI